MAFFDDFTLDYTNKIISHTSGTTIYSGLTMYSEFMDLFDALNQMDDAVPISAQTPTQFTIINGWFIAPADLEYINSASIQTSGWAGNVIEAISFDASGADTPFAAGDIGLLLDGTTTGATGTIVGYENQRYGTDLGIVWYRPVSGTFNNSGEAYTVTTGTGTGSFTTTLNATYPLSGESIWSGFNTIGSLTEAVAGTPDTKLYVLQDKTAVGLSFDVNNEHASHNETNGALGSLGAIDILVQTQEMGKIYDTISNGRIQIFARQQGSLYDHFESIPSSLTANTPIPLAASTDINNTDGTLLVNGSGGIGTFTVGEIITDTNGTSNAAGIVRAVAGTAADPDLDVFEIGDLDLSASSVLLGDSSGATANVDSVSAINAAASPQTTITINFARVSQDLNNGNGSKDYSITIDGQAQTATDVYEALQYRMRRGETTDIDSPGGTLGVEGQVYKGIEVRLDYDTATGNAVVGEIITGGTSGATGQIASATASGATGYVMVTQLNGTFQTSEQATTATLTAANVTTVTAIQSSKQGPLATLAGGVLFGQTGVYITNLAGADAQNFTLIADDGTTQAPPNTQSVTVTDLVAGDSVLVIHRDSSGDPVKLTTQTLNGTEVNHNTFTLEINSADATTLQIALDGESNTDIQLDVPDGGNNDTDRNVIRVRDDSLDVEYRMRYSSYTGDTFTLTAVDDATGTLAAGGNTTTMVGTATTWDPDGTATEGVRVGDIVINRTDSEIGYVVSVDSDTQLTTTTMSNSWASKLYSINRVPIALTTSDTAYVPFLDRIALSTSESSTIIKTTGATGDKSVLVRVRDGGATPIFPFEGTNTIGDSGLSTPAIRTADGIAT